MIKDIDNILARYDDNLLYISKFTKKNKDTKKKFINLQLFLERCTGFYLSILKIRI